MSAIERQLMDHEGFVSHVYEDSRGFATIGFGRMIDKRIGGGITLDEALMLLRGDIAKAEHELYASFEWYRTLDDVRKRVMIDMVYNMGLAKLLKFKGTLAAMAQKDYAKAAAGIRDSLYAKQVGNRAERLARMLESGDSVPKWW